MENPGLTISPYEVLNPAVLPVPEGSLPLSLLPRNFGPLDKTLRGIVRRASDQFLGNLAYWWKQLCLGWKKKSRICNCLPCWDHRGSTFATRYFSPVSWAHSPGLSCRAGKRKKSSRLHWPQVCLSGAARTRCHLEGRGLLDHPRVPNQTQRSNPLGFWRQSTARWGFSLPLQRTPKREHGSGTREPRVHRQLHKQWIGVATLVP